MSFEVKKKALEKEVKKVLAEFSSSRSLEEAGFAIYEDSGIQVKVVITRNEDDMLESILKPYDLADE